MTEDEEDYKKTASAVTGYEDATTGVIGTIAGDNKAVKTSFQNQRDGVIPTGVILTVLPFALLFGAGAAGFVFMSTKKKRG